MGGLCEMGGLCDVGGLYPLRSTDISEQGDSVLSLLVEAGPHFCPSWVFLSNEEEGVVLSCSVSVMGMSFFFTFSVSSPCVEVYGGGSFVVFCPVCGHTVFVILLVTSGQLMFCSSSLRTWFSSSSFLSIFFAFNLLQVNISMIAGVLMCTQIRSSIKCDKTVFDVQKLKEFRIRFFSELF